MQQQQQSAAAIDMERNRISISFNRIGKKAFDETVAMNKRKTVASLKDIIAGRIGVDAGSFRLRLSARYHHQGS